VELHIGRPSCFCPLWNRRLFDRDFGGGRQLDQRPSFELVVQCDRTVEERFRSQFLLVNEEPQIGARSFLDLSSGLLAPIGVRRDAQDSEVIECRLRKMFSVSLNFGQGGVPFGFSGSDLFGTGGSKILFQVEDLTVSPERQQEGRVGTAGEGRIFTQLGAQSELFRLGGRFVDRFPFVNPAVERHFGLSGNRLFDDHARFGDGDPVIQMVGTGLSRVEGEVLRIGIPHREEFDSRFGEVIDRSGIVRPRESDRHPVFLDVASLLEFEEPFAGRATGRVSGKAEPLQLVAGQDVVPGQRFEQQNIKFGEGH